MTARAWPNLVSLPLELYVRMLLVRLWPPIDRPLTSLRQCFLRHNALTKSDWPPALGHDLMLPNSPNIQPPVLAVATNAIERHQDTRCCYSFEAQATLKLKQLLDTHSAVSVAHWQAEILVRSLCDWFLMPGHTCDV